MASLGGVALANRVVTTDCDDTRPGEPLWPIGHAARRAHQVTIARLDTSAQKSVKLDARF